jgi:hypothetical protein
MVRDRFAQLFGVAGIARAAVVIDALVRCMELQPIKHPGSAKEFANVGEDPATGAIRPDRRGSLVLTVARAEFVGAR